MKIVILIILALILSISGSAQTSLLDQINSYTLPLVATNNFSGNILIQYHGKEIFSKSYGYSDQTSKQLINEKTAFQIASVSKAITATAIMRLYEKGLLRLDQPLTDFIPDYPKGNKITIHHLLTHTSGIANINDLLVYDSLEQLQHTPADLIPWFKDDPFEFEPGAQFGYSNSNYTLLAFIIEKVTGQSYGDFLQKEFFKPLKMKHTGHPEPGKSKSKNFAVGYEPDGIINSRPARTINWTVKTGNGSLYSTIGDLQRWASHFLNGKIVSQSTVQKMLTPYADKMGYGWFISPRNGKKQYHINGRSPGYSSVMSYYPDSALLIIVLSNNYVPLATQMSIDFASIVFGEPYTALIEGDGKTNQDQITRFVGKYQFGPDFYRPDIILTVSEKDGYLVTDWGALYYKGSNTYILRDYWSDVKFEVSDTGQVKMIYDGFEGIRL